MKKEVFRLIFGFSLTLAVGLAFAQTHNNGGGSGNSGGSGSSGSHTSGGGGGYQGGGGNRGSGGSGTQNGGTQNGGGMRYGGGMRNGNPQNGGSGYQRNSGGQGTTGSRYYGGYTSRNGGNTGSSNSYQTGGGRMTNGSRSTGYSQSHYSGSSQGRSGSTTQGRSGSTLGSRYSGSYSSTGAVRTSGYYGRTGAIGDRRVVAQNGFDHGHANLSRSGQVTYGSNYNRYGSTGITGAERFGAPHRGLINDGVLGRVIGGDRGLVRGGWRTGYFGYWGGWRDSFFAFPFYVFDPWFGPCYCSPWYYYPCLPAYIAAPRVIIVDSYPSTGWQGDDYDWAPGNDSSPNVVLDDSVQDVIQAFEADDHTALDRVVPHSGNVNIYTDGKYGYTLKANDFYDTYVDGIESTKTDRYEIVDVKASKDGATARVTAKHVYNDPWGNRTYVYHSYFLVKEGDEYVIREFGTSDSAS